MKGGLHLLIPFPKFSWANTLIFTEQSVQMALLGKSKFLYDFIDSHIGMQKSVFYHLHFIIQNILLHGFIGLLLKISP